MENKVNLLTRAFIDVLKHPRDVDLCSYCKNHVKCEGEKCPQFCSGIGDAEGKYPNWRWTCEEFNFGTCPMMYDTPCNGCIGANFAGFELDFEKLEKNHVNPDCEWEEDDFRPRGEKWANIDVFMKTDYRFESIHTLAAFLKRKYGWNVDTDDLLKENLSGEYPIYYVRVYRPSMHE
jgi:hypothetical protein